MYPTLGNFVYYGDQATPLFYFPQIVIPVTFQNPDIQISENLQNYLPRQPAQNPSLTQIHNRIPNTKIQEQDQEQKEQVNIKNIIPNLVRKLFGFLKSERCRELINRMDPSISKNQISRVFTFVQSIKNSPGTYIGKRDLRKLWYKDSKAEKSNKTYTIIRRLSRFYLQNQCINSIMMSRRIKSSLKITHLGYRRKLIRMLYENPHKLR